MADTTVSRLTVLEKGLTVVTALLALGTGFLGYKSATISQARDQAKAVVADTNSDLVSLQEKYDALQAENTRLRAQLGLPGPNADPQATTDAAAVRHNGELVLAAGSQADLDSPPSDPQWDDGSSDIYYDGSSISVYGTSLYLGDKEANYEVCRNTTGYGTESLSTAVGAYACVKTGENRYSALRITQFDSAKVTLDVVTYDPPDN